VSGRTSSSVLGQGQTTLSAPSSVSISTRQ
jgi:hypothetical protein